ncbi:hypothetical protein Sden_1169 [Shewanella denitrificans OS217]|jgi:hypothetical protein|uniref:Ferritin-like domain-containing protein n=1 Tax=Shewanella denitrificans (strain OS217 / ATCC BAA-1090 / DSM 15013) TaxID=318161 RepID=Q12Q21_SHEDO|nr:hypothetical protein [Shewanella denitrificans]ABE54455.1 hypothetical protein Sden_1169 [Shewanella denitrificans OS217]
MNIEDLIKADVEYDHFLNVARLSLSHNDSPDNYPKYMEAIEYALERLKPEFDKKSYGDAFREASEDAQWFATSLVTNSEREGDGATRLWSMAACCDEEEEKELVKRHAVDESRHSTMYLKMLDYTFPDAIEPEFRQELEDKLSPHYALTQDLYVVEDSEYARKPSVDDYIQMNIAEIRTAMHHMLQRKALERFCPEENFERVSTLSRSLLRDELIHVGYTAKLIEEKADEGLNELFFERLNDFNEITKQELAQKVFD